MPNSFAGLAQRFPAEKEGQSLEEQVRELRDYSYQLLEYLRYALQHLDPSNFNETEMEQWITEPIAAEIRDVNGNIAQMQLTAEQFATRLQNAEGSISQVQQTANSISSTVSNQAGQISSIQQTASGIQSTVADLDGKYSSLQQTVDGFDFTGLVTFTDLEDELDGYATENDLRRGNTVISGGCITTGTIDLEEVQLANGYGSLEMASGSTATCGTKGAALYGPDTDVYFIVTNAACRMTAVDNNFYVSETRIHGDMDPDWDSDRRIKNGFVYDLQDTYEAMYKALKPCRYKRNDSQSDRYHTGFVAQEVEEAIAAGGLTNKDLAALVIGEEDGKYSLRYTELIALNTAFVQKLLGEVDSLKAELDALKGGNDAT